MNADAVPQALEQLRVQRREAADAFKDLEAKYLAGKRWLDKLDEAIAGLELISNDADTGAAPKLERAAANPVQHSNDSTQLPPVSIGATPAPIHRYIAHGGDGSRLRSTQMVADFVRVLDPVPRYQIRQMFYAHYGIETLERFWDKPDNAFGNALRRAISDGQIIETADDIGEPMLSAGRTTRQRKGGR